MALARYYQFKLGLGVGYYCFFSFSQHAVAERELSRARVA
jgi:hypothetical protein